MAEQIQPHRRPARLASPRLRLRPWTPSDTPALHRIWTDPDVRRFLWDDEIIDHRRADATVRLGLDAAAEPGLGFWMIEPPGVNAAVGFVGLWRRDEPGMADPELLYGLLPAWWGRGLATEAARLVLAQAFDAGRFARIIAATDPPNSASTRVMERLGMRFERRGLLHGRETVFYVTERGGI
jgi:[ribosomal protein S5]-alanine N-acetyltransferase